MRPKGGAAKFRVQLSSSIPTAVAAPPKAAARCNTHACPWWPYSNSKDFGANATIILLTLFCSLLCGLALNATIRCFLGQRRRRCPLPPPPVRPEEAEIRSVLKPTICTSTSITPSPTTLVLSSSSGIKQLEVGADGDEAECAICLSELVEGEGIEVVGRCRHGFHIQCIQEWLSSHSSCPTCRASYLPPNVQLLAPGHLVAPSWE